MHTIALISRKGGTGKSTVFPIRYIDRLVCLRIDEYLNGVIGVAKCPMIQALLDTIIRSLLAKL
jgi:hypothetical protein